MKTLLFVSHAPSANTQRLADRCFAEINAYSEKITAIHKNSQKVTSQDGLACDGLIIATTENIGYMAGLTKDIFDR
ncbi:MAG: flavodoxin family protein, partial [Candidatus Puniceispirillaceae bacterium]